MRHFKEPYKDVYSISYSIENFSKRFRAFQLEFAELHSISMFGAGKSNCHKILSSFAIPYNQRITVSQGQFHIPLYEYS